MNKIKLSIIIPTYNRKDMLEQCLNSITSQTTSKDRYEVIVIDDGSSDKTDEMVRELQKKHINLYYFRQEHEGAASARNLGASKAKGEILAFTDTDCMVPEDFLENIEGCFQRNPTIPAFLGREVLVFQKKPFRTLSNYYKMQHQKGKEQEKVITKLKPAGNLNSSAFAIRRNCFFDIKGYNDKFEWAGEDYDFEYRLIKAGYKIYLTGKIYVYHYKYDTIVNLIKKFYEYKVAEAENFKNHFKNSLVLKFPYRTILSISHCPFSFYIEIGHFEYLTTMIILLFFYPAFSISGMIVYTFFVYAKTRNFKVLLELILFEYIIGFAGFVGKLVGSFRSRVIYI